MLNALQCISVSVSYPFEKNTDQHPLRIVNVLYNCLLQNNDRRKSSSCPHHLCSPYSSQKVLENCSVILFWPSLLVLLIQYHLYLGQSVSLDGGMLVEIKQNKHASYVTLDFIVHSSHVLASVMTLTPKRNVWLSVLHAVFSVHIKCATIFSLSSKLLWVVLYH